MLYLLTKPCQLTHRVFSLSFFQFSNYSLHHRHFTQSKQQGEVIDVRAAKVVAGLEPECTNAFLIALAECAADPKYDTAMAVGRCLGGEMAGSGPACVKGGGRGAEAKGGDSDAGAGAKAEIMPAESKALNDFKSEMGDTAERGKSRGGTYSVLLFFFLSFLVREVSLSLSFIHLLLPACIL
jgi:hypothetical protein